MPGDEARTQEGIRLLDKGLEEGQIFLSIRLCVRNLSKQAPKWFLILRSSLLPLFPRQDAPPHGTRGTRNTAEVCQPCPADDSQ